MPPTEVIYIISWLRVPFLSGGKVERRNIRNWNKNTNRETSRCIWNYTPPGFEKVVMQRNRGKGI